MPLDLTLVAAFVVAAIVTWAVTPLAALVARATNFIDEPVGYKGHNRPTPYLGGSAVVAGIVVGGLAFGDVTGSYGVLVACAVGLWALGTADDRFNLSPYLRLAAEIGAGAVLYATGNAWAVFDNTVLDLLLTCVWVVGIVNAVNLMDNMDGAAATVAGVSAAGAGALAALSSEPVLAALCFALSGACAGFLPHNLARPARIFMGDGGSMPLGILLAGVSMAAVSHLDTGAAQVSAAAIILALVILDTTLVTVSRRRGGRPLMTGGRDHLTHRLSSRLHTARGVAALLATTQLALCALVIALSAAPSIVMEASAALLVLIGARLIWYLESPPWFDQPAVNEFAFEVPRPAEAAPASAGPG